MAILFPVHLDSRMGELCIGDLLPPPPPPSLGTRAERTQLGMAHRFEDSRLRVHYEPTAAPRSHGAVRPPGMAFYPCFSLGLFSFLGYYILLAYLNLEYGVKSTYYYTLTPQHRSMILSTSVALDGSGPLVTALIQIAWIVIRAEWNQFWRYEEV